MSWLGRLLGDRTSEERFVALAMRGPADCRIAITAWSALYGRLTGGLTNEGLPDREVIQLVNDRLLGVCPECHTWTSGELLSTVIVTELFAKTIFTGPTGGLERLLEGFCRNDDCTRRDILIFWKPDEDRSTIARMAKMGIRIRPRYSP